MKKDNTKNLQKKKKNINPEIKNGKKQKKCTTYLIIKSKLTTPLLDEPREGEGRGGRETHNERGRENLLKNTEKRSYTRNRCDGEVTDSGGGMPADVFMQISEN